MKNRWTSVVLFLLVAVSAMAAPRTRQQAQKIAERVARENNISVTTLTPAKAPRRANAASKDESYYIFNYPNEQGYTIVSGDDQMPEVVGYTTNGTFDAETAPDGLIYYLEQYEATLDAVKAGDAQTNANVKLLTDRRKAGSILPISPLVKTKWNQMEPFNNLCPLYNDEDRSATGCVATAMAQIINYYHTSGQALEKTIPSHRSDISDIIPTTYDWANMKNEYISGSYTDEEATAVATLMLHCGIAVRMSYGSSSGSSISSAYSALKEYFNADSHSLLIYRSDYALAQWLTILDNELNASRAIYLSGQSYRGSGHAFICDGRDNKGYYHINWGWGGMSDGYFDITILSPSEQGTGGSSYGTGFGSNVAAIIGLAPNGTISDDLVEEKKGFTLSEAPSPKLTFSKDTRSSASESFEGTCHARVVNFQKNDEVWTVAVAYSDGDNYHIISDQKKMYIWGGGFNRDCDFTINYALPIGTWLVCLVQSKDDGANWIPLIDGLEYSQVMDVTATSISKHTGSLLTASVSVPPMKMANEGTLTIRYQNITPMEYNNKCTVYISTNSTLDTFYDTFNVENVCLTPHATKDILLKYVPQEGGKHYIWIRDASGNTLVDGHEFDVEEIPGFVAPDGFGFASMPTLGTNGYATSESELKFNFTLVNNSDVDLVDQYFCFNISSRSSGGSIYCWCFTTYVKSCVM